jgi:hypothetical protein
VSWYSRISIGWFRNAENADISLLLYHTHARRPHRSHATRAGLAKNRDE